MAYQVDKRNSGQKRLRAVVCVCQLAFAILMSAVYAKQGISLNFSEKMLLVKPILSRLFESEGETPATF